MLQIQETRKPPTVITMDSTCRHTPALPKDPLKTTSIHTRRSYALNKAKALQKKLDKCQANTSIEMKDSGRQMIISCSTAYYENLRNNIFQYFDDLNKQGKMLAIETHNISDSDGHIVEHVIRVSKRLKQGTPGQRTKFVLNLIRTTASWPMAPPSITSPKSTCPKS